MPDDFLRQFLAETKPPDAKPKGTTGDDTVPRVLDDEFSKLGYPSTARLSMLGDVGRENSWDRKTIFAGHSDPANQAFNRGIISWQGDRRAKLDNYLKQQGVFGRGDDEELRGMARFMDHELQTDYPDVHAKLKNPKNTFDASEALRQYIKYNPGGPYNSPDPEFRVAANKQWANRAKALGLAQGDAPNDGVIDQLLAKGGQSGEQSQNDSIIDDLLGNKKPAPGAALPPTNPTNAPAPPSTAGVPPPTREQALFDAQNTPLPSSLAGPTIGAPQAGAPPAAAPIAPQQPRTDEPVIKDVPQEPGSVRAPATQDQIFGSGQLPQPLPNQDYRSTGKLKTADGRQLTLDLDPTSGVLPAGVVDRFKDDKGNTYVLKDDGTLADESLAEVAERLPVKKIPLEQQHLVPVEKARENIAIQAAGQLAQKYDLDSNETYKWLLAKGVVDLGTENPAAPENLYETPEDRQSKNSQLTTPSIGQPGQTGPSPFQSADSTYSLTGRQVQQMLADVKAATQAKEQFVLDKISQGAISPEPTQDELRELGVELPHLLRNPGFYAARERGQQAQANIERIGGQFQQQGMDAIPAKYMALGELGIISKDQAAAEAAAYNRLLAEKTQANAYRLEDTGSLGVPDTVGRSTAMAGGLDRPTLAARQERMNFWIQRQMQDDLRRYGSPLKVEAEKQKAAAEEAAAKAIVADGFNKVVAGFLTGNFEPGTGEAVKNMGASLLFGTTKGAIKSWGSLFQGAPVYMKLVADYLDSKFGTQSSAIKDNAMYQFGKWIKDAADEYLPTDKNYDKSFVFGSLPQGAGSSFGFMPAAVGGPLGIALFSTLQMAGDPYEQAKDEGATERDARIFGIANGTLFGWTEILGLGETFQRMLKGPAAATWKKLALEAIKESAEEVFLNEGPQDIGESVLAKLTYDPNRSWDKGVAEGMGAAGISAPLVSVLVSGLLHLRHAHLVKKVAERDMINGGPAVRDFGEESGFYVYGKPVAETEDLKPRFERHRELSKDLESEFETLADLDKRYPTYTDTVVDRAGNPSQIVQRPAKGIELIARHQAEILRLAKEQANVAQEIQLLSGVPAPDALELKDKAEEAKAAAVAQDPVEPIVPKSDAEIAGQIADAGNLPAAEQQAATGEIQKPDDVTAAIDNIVSQSKPANETNTQVPAQPAPVAEKPLVQDQPSEVPGKAPTISAPVTDTTQTGPGSEAPVASSPSDSTAQSNAAEPTKPRPPIAVQGIKLDDPVIAAFAKNPYGHIVPGGSIVRKGEREYIVVSSPDSNGFNVLPLDSEYAQKLKSFVDRGASIDELRNEFPPNDRPQPTYLRRDHVVLVSRATAAKPKLWQAPIEGEMRIAEAPNEADGMYGTVHSSPKGYQVRTYDTDANKLVTLQTLPANRFSKEQAVARMHELLNVQPEAKAASTDEQKQEPATIPSADDYVGQALDNLQKTSRTAQGTIDTSSTPGKEDLMTGVSGEEAATLAKRNVEKAIRGAHDIATGESLAWPGIPDGQTATKLADDMAATVNQGIVKDPAEHRQADTKFPGQTAVKHLHFAFVQFGDELANRLADKNADPVETAAWIEWRANMVDHFWADGVGKASRALAAIPLIKAGLPLPKYGSNKEFYSYAPKEAIVPDGTGKAYLTPDWHRFLDYYRSLFPGEAKSESVAEATADEQAAAKSVGVFDYKGEPQVVQRIEGLTKEQAAIQEATIERFLADPQKYVDLLKEKFPGVPINTDNARELFPEYVADRTHNNQAVHAAASAVAWISLIDALDKAPKGSLVSVLAGGPGAGKTSTSKRLGLAGDVTYDAVVGSKATADRIADAVLDRGHHLEIHLIYRPIDAAAVSNIYRWLDEGRIVPVSVVATGHVGQQAALEYESRFAKRKIKTTFYDNSGKPEEVHKISLEEFKDLVYTDTGEATRIASEATNAELDRIEQSGDKRFDVPKLRKLLYPDGIPGHLAAGSDSEIPGRPESGNRGDQGSEPPGSGTSGIGSRPEGVTPTTTSKTLSPSERKRIAAIDKELLGLSGSLTNLSDAGFNVGPIMAEMQKLADEKDAILGKTPAKPDFAGTVSQAGIDALTPEQVDQVNAILDKKPTAPVPGAGKAGTKPAKSAAELFRESMARKRDAERKKAEEDDDPWNELKSSMGLKSELAEEEQPFYAKEYAKYKPIFEKIVARFDTTDPAEQMDRFIDEMHEQMPLDAIQKLEPYVTKFFDENVLQSGQIESIDKSDGSITSDNSEGSDLRPDNGVGGETQNGAGDQNAPRDLASGQSETTPRTGPEGATSTTSGEAGAEPGSSTGSKGGSVESSGSDVRTTSEGGSAITPASTNFHVTDELNFDSNFSPKRRAAANIEALRLLKTLDEENRQPTAEEKSVLARYVGWGGISQIFNDNKPEWAKEREALESLITPEEFEKARRSTQDAHFTSKPVVDAIWNGLRRLGFEHGSVLEPALGSGNFFGLMPQSAKSLSRLTGVELEPLTYKIASYLYPNAEIYNRGFQDFYVAPGSQDIAIGNPPFGAQSIRDRTSKELSKLKIHGYFFAKSIDTLRPGGILAMVVSDGFMDARDSQAKAAREYVGQRARLLGAIRLPDTAFRKNANTEVTTDILFFQRTDLDHDVKPNPEEWLETSTMPDEATGEPITLNKYFIDNPDMMLGKMSLAGTMYGPMQPTLEARPNQDLEKDLAAAVEKLPENVLTDSRAVETERLTEGERKSLDDYPGMKPFNIGIGEDGKPFMLKVNMNGIAREEPLELTGKALERVTGMVAMRNVTTQYIAKQAQEETTEEDLKPLRDELNNLYDAFVKKHGFINQEANKRLFRNDADYPLLQALEKNFDKGVTAAGSKKEGIPERPPSAEKSDILLKRTNFPHKEITSAETAHDAMIVSLVNRGMVDMPYMAQLYGKSEADIVNELGDALYHDPALDRHVMAEEYLSGDVKTKLAQAQAAVEDHKPEYGRNVVALQKVQPADISPADIFTKVGSSWIPASDYSAFFTHLTGGSLTAKWSEPLGRFVDIHSLGGSQTLNTERWGTRRAPASRIIEALLSNRQPVVKDNVGTYRQPEYVVNQEETAAAVGKADEIRDEFQRWLWDDTDRRKRLGRLYNDRFNRIVDRKYDGSYLVDENGTAKMPGLSRILTLRPHILNAVSRILQTGKALIDHAVGAGKTPLAIVAGMEMRRLGQAQKPMYVVPNHLIEQWAQEFKKFYPGANILAASRKDFEKGKRKELFAKIATGDWDAVVVAHSSFSFIPVPREVETKFINDQMAEIIEALKAAQAAQQGARKPRSVKDLEKLRDKLRDRLQALADTPRDNLLDFAEMGVDALFVDEAHKYKNLFFTTQKQGVAGLGNTKGSQRAFDMFMKTQMLLQRNNNRNVVFLTGTPVSNSLSEIFHMQRFLQNDLLKERGLGTFDGWANTFAQDAQDWEIDAAGRFHAKTRFTKLANLPELRQMWRMVTDSISHKDLQDAAIERGDKFPIPLVNQIQVIADRSPAQAEYIGVPRPQFDDQGFPIIDLQTGQQKVEYDRGTIVYRLENWKELHYLDKFGQQHEENVLRITTHARQAGLDMRLINDTVGDFPGGKLTRVAENVIKAYQENDYRKGTQLVFLDVTSPKGKTNRADVRPDTEALEAGETPDENEEALNPDDVYVSDQNFDAYQDIRQKLIKGGIPANQIAFIHDYNTDLQKADLFHKMNRGDLRVLLGSTPKMGEGMNVQKKLVALHNLDAPWKPSDLEQRNGRIIRQGNEFYEADPDNFTVDIYNYATEKTYDARMWEINEQKGTSIDRFRYAGNDVREVEDISAESANAAEMKAAASGDPRILESIKLQGEVRKLETQMQAHRRSQLDMQSHVEAFERRQTREHTRVEELTRAASIAKAHPEKPENELRIGDQQWPVGDLHPREGETDKEKAQRQKLREDVAAAIAQRFTAAALREFSHQVTYVGTYRGFALHASFQHRYNGGAAVLSASIIGESEHTTVAETGFADLLPKNAESGTMVVPAANVSVSGFLTRLDNMVDGLPKRLDVAKEVLEQKGKEIETAKGELDKPFIRQAEYEEKKAKSAELLQSLRAGGNIEFEADPKNTALASFPDIFSGVQRIEFQRTQFTNPEGDHSYLYRVVKDNGSDYLVQGPPERLELDPQDVEYVKDNASGVLINRLNEADRGEEEGRPLYSVLDDMASEDEKPLVEQMRQLPYEPIETVLNGAEMTRRGDLLKMNPKSHELLRRSFEEYRMRQAEAKGQKIKASDYENLFGGTFLDPQEVHDTVSVLRDKAKEAADKGYTPEEVKTFNDHADMLEDAAKAGNGTVAIYILKKDIRHELFHQADYLGAAEKTLLNRHSDESKAKLDSHAVKKILWEKHFSRFNTFTRIKTQKDLDARLRAEIPPYLLDTPDAQLEAMGITPDMRDDYMLTWFEGYVAKNGLDALDNFEKDEIDVQNFLQQAKESYQPAPAEHVANGPPGQEDEEGTNGLGREPPSGVGANAESDRGSEEGPFTTGGVRLTAETHLGRRIEKRQAEKDMGLGDDQRLRSLPMTLRRAGLDAIDDAYEVFHDGPAIEAATDLLEKYGIAGSIELLRSLPARALDAEHGILSFMLIKALQTHAASVRDTQPEVARDNFELSLQIGREHAIAATQLGRFTRVPSIVGPSVETLKYAIQGIVEARTNGDTTLSPEAWERIDAMGRDLEAALTKLAEVRREKRNIQAQLKRAKDELAGKKRKRTSRSVQNRQRLVDLIKENKDRVKGVNEARERLKAQYDALKTAPAEDAAAGPLKSDIDPEAVEAMDDTSLDPATLNDFAEVGGMMLTEGLAADTEYLPSDFKAEMIAEFGDGIQPHFNEIYKAAWNKREEWLAEERQKATKEKAQKVFDKANPDADHDLEDWEVEEILGEQKAKARRRRFIERYHRILAGGKSVNRNLAAYQSIIAEIAPSDPAALTASLFAEKAGTARIHQALVDAGITNEADQRQALREGSEVWEKTKERFSKEQEAIANEILRIEGDLRTIDQVNWEHRQELKKAQASVADEMRRIRNGELWYRTSQLADVFNASRTMMASFDLSAALRQGGFFSFAKPELQKKAFATMFHSISEKGFGRAIMDIEAAPNFVLTERMGVDYAVAGKVDEGSIMGEELFRGQKTIEHLPIIGPLVDKTVIGWSERTYTAFLDQQRYVMANLFASELMSRGLTFRDNPAEFKKIGDFINVATGRGTLPSNRFAKVLMDLPLFAPRYTLSRLQLLNMTLNPRAYYNMPPEARKIVAKQAVRFYGTTMGVLGLVTAFGAYLGATVNWDDDDDDFLKIKIGSSKFDILAGTLQPAKVIIKLVHSAIRTKGGTDNRLSHEFEMDIWNAVSRYVRGKLSPAAGLIVDWQSGSDYIGDEFHWGKAIGSRLIPLTFGDIYSAYKLDGAVGTLAVVPAIFGVGLSTYKDKPERPETEAEKLAAKAAAWSAHSDRTQTDAEKALKEQIKLWTAKARQGEDVSAEVNAAYKAKQITIRQKNDILHAATTSYLVDKTEGLSLDEKDPVFLRVWNASTPQEKEKLLPLLNEKMKDLEVQGKLTPSYRTRLEKLGASIPGYVEPPESVQTLFDQFGIKTPDVGEKLTVSKGDKRTLTDTQYDAYRRTALTRIYERVDELSKDPDFQKAPDDEKELRVRRAISRERAKALKGEKSSLREE